VRLWWGIVIVLIYIDGAIIVGIVIVRRVTVAVSIRIATVAIAVAIWIAGIAVVRIAPTPKRIAPEPAESQKYAGPEATAETATESPSECIIESAAAEPVESAAAKPAARKTTPESTAGTTAA